MRNSTMRLQSRLIFLGAASLLSLGAQAASPQPEILRAVRSDHSASMRAIILTLPPEQA